MKRSTRAYHRPSGETFLSIRGYYHRLVLDWILSSNFVCSRYTFRRKLASFFTFIMALCISVVSKDNVPKYVATLNQKDELKIQYEIHSSIDFADEKLRNGRKEMRDLYLGLLYSTEEHKIYGYVTNTKVKFFIVIDSSNLLLRDNEIRYMFRRLHTAFTQLMCNPFYTPGDYITFKSFKKAARGILTDNK